MPVLMRRAARLIPPVPAAWFRLERRDQLPELDHGLTTTMREAARVIAV